MKVIGYGLFFLAGIFMLILEIATFLSWWGTTGLLIGIFFPPATAIFPFVYWFKEGIFPTFYFLVWGVGIIGLILASVAD